jgi:DNA repair exonuclease SbcCD ATPase subunit
MSTAASRQQEENPGNGEVREGQNVDKIRDILFGSQMRDYEKRFTRLEERMVKAAEALRDDVKKRFDTLEAYVGQELEALGQRLKAEKAERGEALKELTRETRDTSKAHEKRMSQLDEQLSEAQTELRARILEQSKALTGAIQKSRTEVESALEHEAETLRAEKTDRAMLADLFSELSLRLKDELTLPGK